MIKNRDKAIFPTSHDRGCEDRPEGCSTEIFRLISGVNFKHLELSGGWINLDESQATGALSFDIASADLPMGGFHGGHFEFIMAQKGEVRVRFSLAGTEAFFICKDKNKSLHLPGAGLLKNFCQPDYKMGVSASFADGQWDIKSGRFVGQWAQFNVVLNLLGSTISMEYLRRHVNATVGVDAESIWYSDKFKHEGSDHFSRLILAVSGVVRSENGKWEGNAQASFRPVLIGTVDSFKDFGVKTEASVLYHFKKSRNSVLSFGLEMKADYWSDPETSTGMFTPTDEKSSVYIGAIIGARYGFSSF